MTWPPLVVDLIDADNHLVNKMPQTTVNQRFLVVSHDTKGKSGKYLKIYENSKNNHLQNKTIKTGSNNHRKREDLKYWTILSRN